MTWIDITVEKPPMLKKVLFHWIYEGETIGYLGSKGDICLASSPFQPTDKTITLTHWIALPDCPEKEQPMPIDEIKHINEWLSNRPSATMDPCLDEVLVKLARLRELKSQRRKERFPTRMMDSHNGIPDCPELESVVPLDSPNQVDWD